MSAAQTPYLLPLWEKVPPSGLLKANTGKGGG